MSIRTHWPAAAAIPTATNSCHPPLFSSAKAARQRGRQHARQIE
jgi:hypothetical protein